MQEYVECYLNEGHYAKHGILAIEVMEAIEASSLADWGWRWHEEHGYRFIGVGTTRRRKRVFMVLHPFNEDFDCYEPLAQWENCLLYTSDAADE